MSQIASHADSNVTYSISRYAALNTRTVIGNHSKASRTDTLPHRSDKLRVASNTNRRSTDWVINYRSTAYNGCANPSNQIANQTTIARKTITAAPAIDDTGLASYRC